MVVVRSGVFIIKIIIFLMETVFILSLLYI